MCSTCTRRLWGIFENLSAMVSMTVFPAETRSPVTKSNVIWDHGPFGLGNGCNSPAGRCFRDLFLAHTVQVATYSLMYLSNVSQQKCLLIKVKVLPLPGWQANLEV